MKINQKCTIINNKTKCPEKEGLFNINWSYYSNFYGNSTRMNSCGKNKCIDTNFIKESIEEQRKKDNITL